MKYDGFKIGECVALYSPYGKMRVLGKIISRYFIEWTQGNKCGGWYYNTEGMRGISGDLLSKV